MYTELSYDSHRNRTVKYLPIITSLSKINMNTRDIKSYKLSRNSPCKLLSKELHNSVIHET